MSEGFKPAGGMSVMAARQSDPRALDLFPTPPWATRALFYDVIGAASLQQSVVWEPAAGLGTMSEVIAEFARTVVASDVHDYGKGHVIGSFVGEGADVVQPYIPVDWVITNPPFNLALEFAMRGLEIAQRGVALLVRSVWSEGGGRHRELFSKNPPTQIAQFCERVPMVAGRWDPKASTATSYAWFVWRRPPVVGRPHTEFVWIPPGARARRSRPDDVARFASEPAVAALEG
jgi:hypothetical protein